MKKLVLIIVVVAVAVVAYFSYTKKSDKPEAPKQEALAISKNSAAFNTAFNDLLAKYYTLKNAFVEWDTAQASAAANALAASVSKVPLNELKADSAIILTARSFSEGINAEAQAIAGEKTIEGKRRSFNILSDNLYNLARTVKYDQAVVYHQHCPMAFNDEEEAFWLSDKNVVENPYLGKKHPKYKAGMLECGDVPDSIDFRGK
ncbi:DUF3347 domain-containing protein [Filimonas effusa]|uniref:DUF3347 domain-containing protein n=1 Tax=Filimonas effusa TaxID=2508721 RepID=A0A4Q1DCB0_9BACT|nr:DUF3347 domain-containing protein [Filimonas effusa]RXK86169.1 DUF3347 domain-containing protein [Filimonas effusa]